MIVPEEMQTIYDRMNDDQSLSFDEEKKFLMIARLMVNRVRYGRPIDDHVHNACAGVWHMFDWPWNELMRTKDE